MIPTRRAAPLPVSFFDRPVETVAQELLGALMVSELGGKRTAGRIVETEAYLGYYDPASHGFRHRRNQRNAALFGPPGMWYVYLSYGMHWCCNLVCEDEGRAAAVLIRALDPVEGIEVMRRRRGGVADRDLCSGPGKLCQALGLTRELDGEMMQLSAVTVSGCGSAGLPAPVLATPRIGITKAADWPLRFIVDASTERPAPRPARNRRPKARNANGQR